MVTTVPEIGNSTFLIHPRGMEHWLEDVTKRIPGLRSYLGKRFNGANPTDDEISAELLRAPTVLPRYYGKTSTGQNVRGIFAVLPLTGQQLLDLYEHDRKKFFERICHAMLLLKAKGVSHIGTGALTGSVLTFFGGRLPDLPGVTLNSGNTLTGIMTADLVKKVIEDFSIQNPLVAILGAGGSVGSVLNAELAQARGLRLMLVDSLGRAEKQVAKLKSQALTPIFSAKRVEEIATCDIVVVLTSASPYCLKREHLKSGTVVIDCTTPRNTTSDLGQFPEILVLDGDAVLAPKIRRFDYGAPFGTIYACHAETLVLALNGINYASNKTNPFVGMAQPEMALPMRRWAKSVGLNQLPPHHSFGKKITDGRLSEFMNFRTNVRQN